jgi:hypothetical protein
MLRAQSERQLPVSCYHFIYISINIYEDFGMPFVIKKTFLAFGLMAIPYMFFAGHVSKQLTKEDLYAVEKLSIGPRCLNTASFEDEIDCIKEVQSAIKELVPNMKCADKGTTIEPLEFLSRGYGCCFDRARFIEKALAYYGFTTRRAAMYDLTQYGWFGLLVPGIPSHAATEVLTKKGWMGVDSNELFILLTDQGEVLTYKSFKPFINNLTSNIANRSFYEKNIFVIYGLFSRHGMFHGPNLPIPEFNFRELLHNS